MRTTILSALAVAAALVIPSQASADDITDRSRAIELCRTQIAAQAGVEASEVRLDQVRVRPRSVRVDLDLWRSGQLTNIRCDVDRGGAELTVASVTPALVTATAAAGTQSR